MSPDRNKYFKSAAANLAIAVMLTASLFLFEISVFEAFAIETLGGFFLVIGSVDLKNAI